jgi:3-keto-disaccharide hydrolase
MEIHTSWIKNTAKSLMLIGAVSALSAWAQPTPIPPAGDALCAAEPTAAQQNDTLVSAMDANGYLSLFDGATFTGWWQSCLTLHSDNNKTQGGIFRISTAEKAIFLTQRAGGAGGLLMTKKKFDNYELVFDYWTDFANDGGIFNRTQANGNCIQNVLDFFDQAAVGGLWGEGRNPPLSIDIRPWKYNGSLSSLSIPGNSHPLSNWTTNTAGLQPTTFGCSAGGCTVADYPKVIDLNGWNQYKFQFYGGVTGGATNPIKSKTYMRKVGATAWTPIMLDTNIVLANSAPYPANYIGLQIHGGGRFSGPKGAWYRNIKWRGLTNSGEYSWTTPSSTSRAAVKNEMGLAATPTALRGSIPMDYVITVSDIKGEKVETFSGKAGKMDHAFKTQTRGWLSVQVKTSQGVVTHRVMRGF